MWSHPKRMGKTTAFQKAVAELPGARAWPVVLYFATRADQVRYFQGTGVGSVPGLVKISAPPLLIQIKD